MRVQRSAEHRIVPWANGLGITADVFLWPAGVEDWTWRLSLADVTDDVPFSRMVGIDRHIMVANGAGMGLTIDGAAEVRMDEQFGPLTFDGDVVTTCRLIDGPINDLNLMVRRGRAVGSLRSVRLAPGSTLATEADDVAVVVLAGSVGIGLDSLTPFDAVLLDAADRTSFSTDDGAWCAVASIRLAR